MSKGFYTAQDGHVVNVLPPVNITGGVTGEVFGMHFHAHASIIILLGVQAAAFTKILLNACTNAAGANATAIGFDLFTQETVNADVTSGRNAISAAGYTPSATGGIFYIIEIDAATLPQGYDYLQLQLTNGANAVQAAAVAILSGSRYASDQSQSVLT